MCQQTIAVVLLSLVVAHGLRASLSTQPQVFRSELDNKMLGHLTAMVNAKRLDYYIREGLHGRQVPSVAPFKGQTVPTQCTDDDQTRLNKTLSDVESLMATVGPAHMVHIFPPTCYEIITGGIDYVSYDSCLQKFFEISQPCAKCHVSYLKSLAGADLFHLGCVKKCAPVMDQCGNQTSTAPEDEPKDCMGAVRNCITCAVPPSKDVLNCAGVPGKEEVIHMLDSLVDFVSGNMTDPAAFETFIRRAGYVPKEDSDEDTVWAVKWPAGLMTADDKPILAEAAEEAAVTQ